MGDLEGKFEGGNFDANEVEPEGDFQPIPAGLYAAVITNMEHKSNKAETGELLEIQFEIVSGEHAGFPIRTWINTHHPNEKAVQIGLGQFSQLCRAVGILTPKDTLEFINKAVNIKVAVEIRNDNGELTNKVKGFEPNGNPPPAKSVEKTAVDTSDLPF